MFKDASCDWIGAAVHEPGAGALARSDVPRPDEAGRRRPARASARADGPARRQPVRPRPSFPRDPHAGRFPQARPDRRLRSARALHRPRPPGRSSAPCSAGDRSAHVRHDLGHDQPAQDHPGHRASRSRDYREGWTIWGILAFDAHPRDDRARPQADPPGRQRLARELHARRHSLRRDHRADRPHAKPPGPHQVLHAGVASRIKDIESKYYVGLRFSIYRDLGTIIAANPSTILAMARLGDREKEVLIRDLADGTIDPAGTSPPKSAGRCRFRTRWPPQGGRARLGGDRRADRPAPAQGLLAQPSVPVELDGRHDAGLSPRLSRVLRRDAGARRRPDRLRGPDDHPHRGRHARRHARRPPPLLRVHPRRAGRPRTARDGRGDRPDRRAKLFHRADDGRRALPVQHLRPGPLRRLPRPGAADRVPQQGGPLSRALPARSFPNTRSWRPSPRPSADWACASSRSCWPPAGASRRITRS